MLHSHDTFNHSRARTRIKKEKNKNNNSNHDGNNNSNTITETLRIIYGNLMYVHCRFVGKQPCNLVCA
jgi:hypothetical protein